MILGEVFRQLQGKQPLPSEVVGKFALFPKPDEQEKIRDYSGEKLADQLRLYPHIATQAAYDSLFALADGSDKAKAILDRTSSLHGNDTVKVSLWTVNELRKKDQAPEKELAAFGQFCAQAGFDFSELKTEEVLEAITGELLLSAVRHHVDNIS